MIASTLTETMFDYIGLCESLTFGLKKKGSTLVEEQRCISFFQSDVPNNVTFALQIDCQYNDCYSALMAILCLSSLVKKSSALNYLDSLVIK